MRKGLIEDDSKDFTFNVVHFTHHLFVLIIYERMFFIQQEKIPIVMVKKAFERMYVFVLIHTKFLKAFTFYEEKIKCLLNLLSFTLLNDPVFYPTKLVCEQF
ncbi:hypothetical protein AM592_01810 [Bacillus gobiensis]|uniref:Uncharacterized protein n=1 Tax=Bacillus gobiensis TaxID=1441095 RepID=A0A0M5J9G0_9BACI|nr:hypothetical protein AM592_01810 [Bacillus gobiensis]